MKPMIDLTRKYHTRCGIKMKRLAHKRNKILGYYTDNNYFEYDLYGHSMYNHDLDLIIEIKRILH
jgi:hypothetical protein